MNDCGIILRRLIYDDSAWNVELRASNGCFSGALEFYISSEDLNAWGEDLCAFPRNPSDEIRLEVGDRTGNWAYYILVRAFLFDRVGHAALEFAVDNRRELPDHAQTSFFIRCDVSSINTLGRQLRAWTRASDETLIWMPQNS